ncbi:probable carboxylesterase 18 [Prosopis cineraria]|uniref:probable carboxylesterase 18 n=1 Tax=Prosopis cineraria TaxID=364024 RepID=UPI00241095C3|nr:probable carboxylesterase 18 [Prosopis cineraria]
MASLFHLPWKVRFSVFFLSFLLNISRRRNGSVNRRLFNFFDLKAPPTPKPLDGVKSSDVIVDNSRNLWFRLFTPTISSSSTSLLPVVIYFHGGGFSFLSASSSWYDAVCRRLSRSIPSIVVSVNYRLCPEHRFPSQYNDGFDVLKFLDLNGDVLPEISDMSRCFLAGDSAGANLAHHLAIRVCQEELRQVKVIGLVSIQPFFGGVDRTESEIRLDGAPITSVFNTDWMWEFFLPAGSDRDHEAVNVTGTNGLDISGMNFPDTIIFVGGLDPLLDRQRKYHEWLKKSGKKVELIEYPNTIHAFYFFPELPPSPHQISRVKDFVNQRFSNMK